MTHLTPQQFVDAIDGALSPVHASHVKSCDACRQEIASLRSLEGDVRAIGGPEPSPLFWEHLSERVRIAASAEPVPAPAWWRGLWNPVMTISLAMGVMAVVFVMRIGPVPGGRGPSVADESLVPGLTEDAANRPPEFVMDLAANLSVDDLQEVARPTPDATAARLDQLTPAQRAEFMRLAKARMNGAE